MKESDLYLPLKEFLESRNYEVKGEVNNCDVLAVRADEDPLVVELKLSLNLDLILQAVARLSLTPRVYIGVPKQCKSLRRRKKQTLKLLRMLGLGLVLIEADSRKVSVQILLDPGPYQPRTSKQRQQRLLGEFAKRVGDPNLGGTAMKKGLMTAYRQRALTVAHYLQKVGATKASDIALAINEPNSRDILYRNVYGWFDRESRGVYKISPRGEQEIQLWE
ncbi:MAG TPA: DUF2161 family putative PD-(D/E)XK-type phosphodiesterase [Gammaproteobacteria bacterium]|mgnify:FL=1|jgi:hypothetical protein|nr:DUF2161 family putative PD-(D/E)XK-type phosphodiesterase [Gammaproteobacteria bacterium]|tara:strand:- start:18681 stop:19340 length:660 start_codon:yes stop_codon:yes gene_type:complete